MSRASVMVAAVLVLVGGSTAPAAASSRRVVAVFPPRPGVHRSTPWTVCPFGLVQQHGRSYRVGSLQCRRTADGVLVVAAAGG